MRSYPSALRSTAEGWGKGRESTSGLGVAHITFVLRGFLLCRVIKISKIWTQVSIPYFIFIVS